MRISFCIHFLALGLLMAMASCISNNEPEDIPATPVVTEAEIFMEDRKKIEAYVAEQNLQGFYTPDSVFIAREIPNQGGPTPDADATVEVIYAGYLLDGTPFDSSEGNVVSFPLQNLIEGWQLALPYFERGAKGIVVIPSRYGYRGRNVGNIPPHSVLVFDLELIDFS